MVFRALTLNLRYGTAPDGEFAWPHRKERLIDVLQQSQADIIGTQEGLADQLREIHDALPDYQRFGVAREDGNAVGEYSAIFVRLSISVVDSGSFWLSDTPNVVGSTSYGNHLTRLATWLRVGEPKLLVINAHLDHESAPSRLQSIRQIAEFASEQPESSTIVMGDFNVPPSDHEFHQIYGGLWFDSQFDLHAGTFHGFSGSENGDRIDYILHSPDLVRRETKILRNRPCYSDHDAVVTDFELITRPPNG